MDGAQYFECALPTTAKKLFFASWPGWMHSSYRHRELYAGDAYLGRSCCPTVLVRRLRRTRRCRGASTTAATATSAAARAGGPRSTRCARHTVRGAGRRSASSPATRRRIVFWRSSAARTRNTAPRPSHGSRPARPATFSRNASRVGAHTRTRLGYVKRPRESAASGLDLALFFAQRDEQRCAGVSRRIHRAAARRPFLPDGFRGASRPASR